MQHELVMVYADGQWEDIYNADSSLGFDISSNEAALNYVKIKYSKRFKNCELVVQGNELLAVCPDDVDLPMINTGEVLKPAPE